MGSKFKTGDRVKCIETRAPYVTMGKIYKVVYTHPKDLDLISIFMDGGYEGNWYVDKFVLADDTECKCKKCQPKKPKGKAKQD